MKSVSKKNNEIFCRRIVTSEESLGLNQASDPILKKISGLLKAGQIENNEPDELSSMGIEAILMEEKI